MGNEADCVVRIGRKRHTGRALLESAEIRFRSTAKSAEPVRLVIRFATIRSLKVRDGWLEIEYDSATAAFELGAEAERWAEKIRSPKSRLDKLGVRPGMRVLVVAVEDSAFEDELAARAVEAVPARGSAKCALAFLGATRPADLEKLPALRARIAEDGAIWVVWPKGRLEFREDDVRRAALREGLVDIKVVAFSETLSGLKLVIPKAQRSAPNAQRTARKR